MRIEKSRKDLIMRLTIVTLFIISFFVVVSTKIKVYTNVTYNNNRSLQTMYLVSKKILNNINFKNVSNINEIVLYGNNNIVSYNSLISGYGYSKNNELSTCLSNFNESNGNIFYHDNQYGNTRIIETDSNIPCGTIIKISKLKNYSDFYAIVLDHSALNLGTSTNLLFESEEIANDFISSNAIATIVRWGW